MSELSDQVRDHFKPRGELYELRHQLARVMNKEEWDKYRSVSKNFADKRRYTERAFELDYPSRFDQARLRLIDEAGSIKRRFVPKFIGADNFDKSEINRRAQNQVRDAHAKDMARIDIQESKELRSMLESSDSRIQQREKPIKDFQTAVDRRSGPDRRVRAWNR
jgi:hypothetical protein